MVKSALNESEQKIVAEALASARTRTSGEILVVIARQSDRYTAAALIFSLTLTVMTATAVYLLHPAFGVPDMGLLIGGIFLLFLSLAELLYLPTCFLPRAVSRCAVRRHAREQFAAHALHAVPGRAAVLILISQRERAVELIADEGIYTKTDAGHWQSITSDLAHGWRLGERAQVVCRAVEACAAVLTVHFPT